MPQRFIGKNPHKKCIRPISRMILANSKPTTVNVEAENKKINEENEMNTIEQLKSIVGDETKIPKRKVKVEKKDKGLIERTEDSAILLTEDDKMMLND